MQGAGQRAIDLAHRLRRLLRLGLAPLLRRGLAPARGLRVAFGVLVERLPNVRLAQDRLEFGENATLRMPRRLLLEWDV